MAHLAASNLADQSVNHAVALARQQQSHDTAQENGPESSTDGNAPARNMQGSFSGFAPSSAGNGSQMATPFSQQAGMDPMDAFAHLPEGLRIQLQNPGSEDMSRANSLVYNQVCALPLPDSPLTSMAS